MNKWKDQIIIFRMGMAIVSLAITLTLIMLAVNAFGALSLQFLTSWGLLTLIPLMGNSAKQDPLIITANFDIAHGDFDGITAFFTLPIVVPVDLWLTEVLVSFNPNVKFDQNVALAFEILQEEGVRQTFSGATSILDEALDIWQTGDQVGSITTRHPHFIWLLNNANSKPIFWKHDYFEFVEGGETVNFRLTLADLDTPPTTGNLQVRIEVKCAVVNYNRSPRRPSLSDPQAYMSILVRTLTGTDNTFAWTPPVDLRLYNVRMSILNGASALVFYGDDKVIDNWTPYFPIATDAIQIDHKPQFYVNDLVQSALDTVQTTRFFKGPFFYHKSDLINFTVNQLNAGEAILLMTCEILPDFNNRTTWNLLFDDDDITQNNEEKNIFTVPWDMYLETVETDFVLTASADVLTFLEVHVIKPDDTLPEGGLDVQGGQILEWKSVLDNQEGGQIPATIIDSLPIAVDFSVTDRDKGTSLEMVLDFVPAGSVIIVNFTGGAGATGILKSQVRVQLEGRSMVKSSRVSKFSYVTGEEISSVAEVINK